MQELGATLKAGVSLGQALRLTSLHLKGKQQQQFQQLALQLERGATLHRSFVKLQVLSPWALAILGMAEQSGALQLACTELAITLTEMGDRRRLLQGMVLRLFRMIWCWAMVIFLLLGGTVASMGFWVIAILVTLGLVGLIYGAIHWQPLGDRLRYIPPFKNLFWLQTLINLGYLQLPLECGVSVGAAVTWLKKDFPDPILKKIMQQTEPQVRRGQSLTAALQPHIPLMVLQIIRTGEESGTLPQSFEQIRQYHQQDLRRAIQLLNLQVLVLSVLSFGFFVLLVGAQALTLFTETLPN